MGYDNYGVALKLNCTYNQINNYGSIISYNIATIYSLN